MHGERDMVDRNTQYVEPCIILWFAKHCFVYEFLGFGSQ